MTKYETMYFSVNGSKKQSLSEVCENHNIRFEDLRNMDEHECLQINNLMIQRLDGRE